MQVETSFAGAVATVTLNRPERMNALTKEMREELIEAFQALRFNDDVRAVVLTANGTNFCAGADIDRMAEDDLRARRDRLQGLSHDMRILHALEKPVIAAVRGHAVGIGMSLVLGCDIVLASDTARFPARPSGASAYAPDGGGIWFLARRLPMNIAKELVFTGRVFPMPPRGTSPGHREPCGSRRGTPARRARLELAAENGRGADLRVGAVEEAVPCRPSGPSLEGTTWNTRRSCSRPWGRRGTIRRGWRRSARSASRSSPGGSTIGGCR